MQHEMRAGFCCRELETAPPETLTSGRDGEFQPQSALKILQQQLESFQALRQQTLQNVSMVQSEINDILNKSIIDMKSPDNLLLPTTSINIAMPRNYQEAPYFKKQLHPEQRPDISHCPESKFNSIFENRILGENTPYQILLKYKANGKSEDHTQASRNTSVLALNNDDKIKNSANTTFSPSFVGLGPEKMAKRRILKNHSNHEISVGFHKYEKEEECLAESVSCSFKDLKEDGKKSPMHDLSQAFELQHSNIACGKDNDSGYLSEQDLMEKAMDVSNEDFKSRRISELEGSIDEFQIAFASSTEKIQRTPQMAYKSSYLYKDHLMKCSTTDKLQLTLLSKVLKDKEKQKHEDMEFSDVNSVSDDYAENLRLLHMSVRESDHVPKHLVPLEHECVDTRNQIKPFTDVIQSLTEQNLRYQNQIKELHDEKNHLQGRLVKSDGDCKECLKEVKRLLKKCKELQQQKAALEEKQDQLCDQNQQMMRDINDFQKKDQKAQESLAFTMKEKKDLTAALESLEKKFSAFQEGKKTLEEEICKLSEKKNLLKEELGERQNEIQQLKENEKSAVSDMEALLQMLQSLKDEKQNFDKTLHEALSSKEVLEKELQDARFDRAHVEEKLLTERKNAKLECGVLKTTLLNTERECERLRTMATTITEGNWVLKNQLHESKQETSKCKDKLRQLSEALLLMENQMRSIENERDVLRFEAQRHQKNNANLKEQVTALVNEQYKQQCNSRSQKQSSFSGDATQICEVASRYQCISLIRDPPGISRQSPSIGTSKKV